MMGEEALSWGNNADVIFLDEAANDLIDYLTGRHSALERPVWTPFKKVNRGDFKGRERSAESTCYTWAEKLSVSCIHRQDCSHRDILLGLTTCYVLFQNIRMKFWHQEDDTDFFITFFWGIRTFKTSFPGQSFVDPFQARVEPEVFAEDA